MGAIGAGRGRPSKATPVPSWGEPKPVVMAASVRTAGELVAAQDQVAESR